MKGKEENAVQQISRYVMLLVVVAAILLVAVIVNTIYIMASPVGQYGFGGSGVGSIGSGSLATNTARECAELCAKTQCGLPGQTSCTACVQQCMEASSTVGIAPTLEINQCNTAADCSSCPPGQKAVCSQGDCKCEDDTSSGGCTSASECTGLSCNQNEYVGCVLGTCLCVPN